MLDLISREALLNDIQAAADNSGMGAVVAGTLKRYVKRVPAVDAVSRGVYDQIKWERDIAIEQLAELGIGFGAKVPDMVEVGACEGCIFSNRKRPQKCSCCRRNKVLKDCYERREE